MKIEKVELLKRLNEVDGFICSAPDTTPELGEVLCVGSAFLLKGGGEISLFWIGGKWIARREHKNGGAKEVKYYETNLQSSAILECILGRRRFALTPNEEEYGTLLPADGFETENNKPITFVQFDSGRVPKCVTDAFDNIPDPSSERNPVSKGAGVGYDLVLWGEARYGGILRVSLRGKSVERPTNKDVGDLFSRHRAT
jgi:hypothetical protein